MNDCMGTTVLRYTLHNRAYSRMCEQSSMADVFSETKRVQVRCILWGRV